ncbi:MAG TPA: hypothetical protein VGN57_20475 [Pirellulaceae bacterium]|nr:hypothetical protein [Pirellulaceae bacterium]
MSPSPVSSWRRTRTGCLAIAGLALVSLFAPRAQAQFPPVKILVPDVQEIYDCSVDGVVAIGGDARQDVPPPPPGLPALPPPPRDKFDPLLFNASFPWYHEQYWNVPVTSLRYITFDNATGTQSQIEFPGDELEEHVVTSLILPRSSAARLVILNTTRDEDGVEKRDSWVWFVDLTNHPDNLVTSVVALGSELDARCCSDDGSRIYCDDPAWANVFWNCQRQQSGNGPGFQYNIFPVTIPHETRGVPANEDVSDFEDQFAAPWWWEESVDSCSADGLIVYGREHNQKSYRATNNEPINWRGTYTWIYFPLENGGSVPIPQIRNEGGPTRDRNLVCTDDGQRAITATRSRIQYSAWNTALDRTLGIRPGFTELYPLEIRNNQRAFGHYIFASTNQNVLPFVLDVPTGTYTTLRLLVGDVRGFEVEADETIDRVLGYSITVDPATKVETRRTLVQWTPSLSAVERLDFVYGIDPTSAPEPTNNIVRLFCASRTLNDLFCTYQEGAAPPAVFRITKPTDPPPTVALAQITTDLSGSGETLTVVFSEEVFSNGAEPTLTLTGGPVTLTPISKDARTFIYGLDRRVNYDETGSLDLAAGAVTDFNLNLNPAIVGQPVINYSDVNRPPPDTAGPTVTGAAIGADGETLTLIFDENVRHVAVPTLTGFKKKVVVKAAGRRVRANTIVYQLSRTIYEGESGNYRLTAGSVKDRLDNLNAPASGMVLNDSTVPDPTEPPPPKPPKDRPITKKRPLGKTANSYAQAAYDTSAYFYQEPYYTENAYYAYLSSYTALSYAYQAGTTVRYGGPKLPKKNVAMRRYKDARYQQVINSYNASQFAYSDYAVTGSTTMVNTYTYAYYAYYYGLADLDAK